MDPFGALQAISAELAFLSPQSVASIGVVVSALAVLKQSPPIQSQADVLAVVQQEHAWAQQVEDGIVAVSEADLDRLKTSYFRIEEALARPIAPAIRATPSSQPAATVASLGDEPSPALFVAATARWFAPHLGGATYPCVFFQSGCSAHRQLDGLPSQRSRRR